jgi:hypothetical protein
MGDLLFDAPVWLAAAAGPGRPVVVAVAFAVALADHRRLGRVVRRRMPSGPSHR